MPTATSGPRDVDGFIAPCREVFADEVWSDRKFSMTAVDHDGKLHCSGPAVVGERIESGADRAAGEEHVVDQHHRASIEVAGNVGHGFRKHWAETNVVSIEGDIKASEGHFRAINELEGLA